MCEPPYASSLYVYLEYLCIFLLLWRNNENNCNVAVLDHILIMAMIIIVVVVVLCATNLLL